MSPILVRPVREQLEHDRVIRLLQAKYKRKFEVAINPGHEQSAPVGGPPPWFPDLVLQSTDKSHKLVGVVEVETTESVNNLEAMSQWTAFARLRVPFHLYVPATMIDVARRLCTDMQIPVAEVWAYSAIGEQIRFTAVVKAPQPPEPKRAPAPAPAPAAAAAAPAPKPAPVSGAARKVTSRSRTTAAKPAAAPARPAARRAAAPATPARRKAAPGKAKAASARPAAKAAPARPAAKAARKAAASRSAPRAQKRR